MEVQPAPESGPILGQMSEGGDQSHSTGTLTFLRGTEEPLVDLDTHIHTYIHMCDTEQQEFSLVFDTNTKSCHIALLHWSTQQLLESAKQIFLTVPVCDPDKETLIFFTSL